MFTREIVPPATGGSASALPPSVASTPAGLPMISSAGSLISKVSVLPAFTVREISEAAPGRRISTHESSFTFSTSWLALGAGAAAGTAAAGVTPACTLAAGAVVAAAVPAAGAVVAAGVTGAVAGAVAGIAAVAGAAAPAAFTGAVAPAVVATSALGAGTETSGTLVFCAATPSSPGFTSVVSIGVTAASAALAASATALAPSASERWNIDSGIMPLW